MFAVARQLAGTDTVAVDLPPDATVADLRIALASEYPGLDDLGPLAVFAINAEYADDETRIPDNAEVACIPPVSGG